MFNQKEHIGVKAPPTQTAPSPGEEGLVLSDGVELVGGGVAPLAGQLFLGVVLTAAGDVDVAAAQVSAALQVGVPGAVAVVHDDPRREQVIVLRPRNTS